MSINFFTMYKCCWTVTALLTLSITCYSQQARLDSLKEKSNYFQSQYLLYRDSIKMVNNAMAELGAFERSQTFEGFLKHTGVVKKEPSQQSSTIFENTRNRKVNIVEYLKGADVYYWRVEMDSISGYVRESDMVSTSELEAYKDQILKSKE